MGVVAGTIGGLFGSTIMIMGGGYSDRVRWKYCFSILSIHPFNLAVDDFPVVETDRGIRGLRWNGGKERERGLVWIPASASLQSAGEMK